MRSLLLVLAVGWNQDAHEAVGMVAMSALDDEARSQLKRLMGGQDAVDVAGYGHALSGQLPGLDGLHFETFDDSAAPAERCGKGALPRTRPCADNACLSESLKHFYGRVVSDEGRKVSYPPIDFGKVAGKKVAFTDADMIKMLVNLLGDVHAPMHVGFASDRNGRGINVTWRGESTSLYDLWDQSVVKAIMADEQSFWWGGWTHVKNVRETFDKEKAEWSTEGAFASFERWVAEAADFACESGYSAGAGEDVSGKYGELRQMVLDRILLGGARLAILLNDLLAAKGASKLKYSVGVSVDGYDGDPGWGVPSPKQRGLTAPTGFLGFFQLVVALGVLGYFVYFATRLDRVTDAAAAVEGTRYRKGV